MNCYCLKKDIELIIIPHLFQPILESYLNKARSTRCQERKKA